MSRGPKRTASTLLTLFGVFVSGAAAQQSELPDEALGIYEVKAEHFVGVDHFYDMTLITDYQTGFQRGLQLRTDGSWVGGMGLRPVDVGAVTVIPERDGNGAVRTIEIRHDGKTVRAFRCCAFDVHEHRFRSGDVTLAGSLTIPRGRGPHAAVVWVHGSGRTTRRDVGAWRLFLVQQGFAVLAVDKRGVGESGGTYELPDGSHDNYRHMQRRAGDVQAAVRSLAQRDDVDPNRIGLVGISQAGWVIPMVARTGRIAFTITISGGATPIDVEGRFSELAGEDTFEGSELTIQEIYQQLNSYHPVGHDFRSDFAAVTAPGLWLYGDNDRVNPTALAAAVIEGVRRDHALDFTVFRWPGANHLLQPSVTGTAPEILTLGQIEPDVFEAIARWLADKGITRPD